VGRLPELRPRPGKRLFGQFPLARRSADRKNTLHKRLAQGIDSTFRLMPFYDRDSGRNTVPPRDIRGGIFLRHISETDAIQRSMDDQLQTVDDQGSVDRDRDVFAGMPNVHPT
jgi:hypothetical protein